MLRAELGSEELCATEIRGGRRTGMSHPPHSHTTLSILVIASFLESDDESLHYADDGNAVTRSDERHSVYYTDEPAASSSMRLRAASST
jgi:hypothetical protein